MNELERAKRHALMLTARTPGWAVVEETLAQLVRNAIDRALSEGLSPTDATLFLHEARGARKLVSELGKITAELK